MRVATSLVLIFGLTFVASAQPVATQIGERDPFGSKQGQSVALVAPVSANVAVGKVALIELRFRVQNGLHINSHTPRESSLIPTAIILTPDATVQQLAWEYPQGVDYSLALQPNYKLSVYTGEFAVRLRVKVKSAGTQTIPATLRYQACDSNACMPPRTLPFTIELTAR